MAPGSNSHSEIKTESRLTAWKKAKVPRPRDVSINKRMSRLHGKTDGPVVVIGADTVVCAEVGVPDGVEVGEIEVDAVAAGDVVGTVAPVAPGVVELSGPQVVAPTPAAVLMLLARTTSFVSVP